MLHTYFLIGEFIIGFDYSDAGTVGARGATGPHIFGRSVNPIPTGEGRLSPPMYYYWHPQCFSPSGITGLLDRMNFPVNSGTVKLVIWLFEQNEDLVLLKLYGIVF